MYLRMNIQKTYVLKRLDYVLQLCLPFLAWSKSTIYLCSGGGVGGVVRPFNNNNNNSDIFVDNE